MSWIRVIALTGVGVCIISIIACEKRFNNPIAKKYVIRGTLFEDYSAPSVTEYALELVYYELNQRDEWINEKTIENTITDKDGYFEFKYSKFSKSKNGFLAIIQDESGLKDGQAFKSLPFLENIPLNLELNRDLSFNPIARLDIILKWNGYIEDTLFVGGGGLRNINQIGYNQMPLSSFAPEGECVLQSRILWDSKISFSDMNTVIYWGLGSDDFYMAKNGHRIDSIADDYNKLWVEPSGFPFIDTVHIDLD